MSRKLLASLIYEGRDLTIGWSNGMEYEVGDWWEGMPFLDRPGGWGWGENGNEAGEFIVEGLRSQRIGAGRWSDWSPGSQPRQDSYSCWGPWSFQTKQQKPMQLALPAASYISSLVPSVMIYMWKRLKIVFQLGWIVNDTPWTVLTTCPFWSHVTWYLTNSLFPL